MTTADDGTEVQPRKPIVLVFANYYLPGYRAGGPIQTIANLVERLGDEFEFRIVCADRDYQDRRGYDHVAVDAWNVVGKAQVFYATKRTRSWRGWRRLLRKTPYDLLYLNSFFSPSFTLLPLLLRMARQAPRKPVLIAPRGEFSPGALRIKRIRKSTFITMARLAGLYDSARWHVSTQLESDDIRRSLGIPKTHIHEARNLVSPVAARASQPIQRLDNTAPRPLRVCFLSRISPKKNLDFALRVLAKVEFPVDFAVYGPIEDEGYWLRCLGLIAALPQHVSVHHFGAVEPPRVRETIAMHDVFFVPTHGENFGHVFVEAWSAAVPVLVSNCTPWRDLRSKGIGWDLPLSDPGAFVDELRYFHRMEPGQVESMRRACSEFARNQSDSPDVVAANRQLFLDALRPT
jgi:glycosyltransferase involved in cell wall biosynthesis